MEGMDALYGMKSVGYAAEWGNTRAEGRQELPVPDTDMLEVSEEYADDQTEAAAEPEWKVFFDEVRKRFTGITFYVGDSLSDCAFADRDGASAVLSHRFMEKLLSGGEEAAEYRERLVNVLERFREMAENTAGVGVFLDTERAVCWKFTERKEGREPYGQLNRVSDMLKDFALSHAKDQERWKKNRQKLLDGGVSNLYALAAMARDKAGTVSVVARINRQISSLKMAAAGAKGTEAAKINATVKSLRKLISKCNSKMRKIERAEYAEAEYKRALKKKAEKKAEECRKEMNRRRRILRCENEGIKNAGMLEDWKNSNSFRLMDEMDRLQAAYQATDGHETIGTADGISADTGITVTETIVF